MLDDRERDEKDTAENIRLRCKKYSPYALSYIDRRIKGSFERKRKETAAKEEKVHNGQRGKEPALLERSKKSGMADNYEPGYISRRCYIGRFDFCYC